MNVNKVDFNSYNYMASGRVKYVSFCGEDDKSQDKHIFSKSSREKTYSNGLLLGLALGVFGTAEVFSIIKSVNFKKQLKSFLNKFEQPFKNEIETIFNDYHSSDKNVLLDGVRDKLVGVKSKPEEVKTMITTVAKEKKIISKSEETLWDKFWRWTDDWM